MYIWCMSYRMHATTHTHTHTHTLQAIETTRQLHHAACSTTIEERVFAAGRRGLTRKGPAGSVAQQTRSDEYLCLLLQPNCCALPTHYTSQVLCGLPPSRPRRARMARRRMRRRMHVPWSHPRLFLCITALPPSRHHLHQPSSSTNVLLHPHLAEIPKIGASTSLHFLIHPCAIMICKRGHMLRGGGERRERSRN